MTIAFPGRQASGDIREEYRCLDEQVVSKASRPTVWSADLIHWLHKIF